MIHRRAGVLQEKVYCKFKSMFPDMGKYTAMWFPNGRDSIRIRDVNKHELIFTYHGVTDWRLETVNEFLKNMKGGCKM